MAETHEQLRERQREYERRYRERNRELLRERQVEQGRKYRERHREERNARKREQYAAKADAINAKRRAKYAADPEPIRQAVREYSEQRREQLREYSRKVYQEHTSRYRTYSANRRARELGAEGAHTEQEWQAVQAQYRHCCAYCGADGKMTRDHRIPLTRGGTNWIDNIVPACASCNNRKRTRTDAEFIAILAEEVNIGATK